MSRSMKTSKISYFGIYFMMFLIIINLLFLIGLCYSITQADLATTLVILVFFLLVLILFFIFLLKRRTIKITDTELIESKLLVKKAKIYSLEKIQKLTWAIRDGGKFGSYLELHLLFENGIDIQFSDIDYRNFQELENQLMSLEGVRYDLKQRSNIIIEIAGQNKTIQYAIIVGMILMMCLFIYLTIKVYPVPPSMVLFYIGPTIIILLALIRIMRLNQRIIYYKSYN